MNVQSVQESLTRSDLMRSIADLESYRADHGGDNFPVTDDAAYQRLCHYQSKIVHDARRWYRSWLALPIS